MCRIPLLLLHTDMMMCVYIYIYARVLGSRRRVLEARSLGLDARPKAVDARLRAARHGYFDG